MDFLNKLYESNYFGIGLFAVISFLVVTFLVVLFFGKKDEKRRKLEAKDIVSTTNKDDLFKETSTEVPVEIPVAPVAPIVPEINDNIAVPVIEETPSPIITETPSVMPVPPINFSNEPLKPVAPISYDEVSPVEEIKPIVEPVIKEEVTPIITGPVETPIVTPVINPTIQNSTVNSYVEPKVMEPIRITIPEEQPMEKPVVKPVVEETPRIVEPAVINDTYYKPIEEIKNENDEIKVPSIDFDALAKSISEELDELEKSSSKREEVHVTPINEVKSKPSVQYSSVYINEPVKQQEQKASKVDLPTPIDLPTKKDEIEPESYNI